MGRQKPRRGRPPGPNAKYRAIAEALRERIDGGDWPPNTPLPALRKLAKAHRVSEYTIRLAMKALRSNGYAAARPGGGWSSARPDASCSPAHNLVVEVINTPLNRFLASEPNRDLQRGIETGLGHLDVPLYIAQGLLVRDELPAYFRELPLRGVLLLGIKQPSVRRRYERLGVPVVLVDMPGEEYKLHAVGPDDEGTAREATARLIALGHRRLAFVRRVQQTVGVDPDSRARERGFLRAARAAGLPKAAARVVNHFEHDRPDGPVIAALLGEKPRVTGALAADLGSADFLRQGAAVYGLTVPRDLSVVTWMESTDDGPYTGWRTDFLALGLRAAGLLKLPPRPPQHVHVPSEWKDGNTVGPPPRGAK